MSDPDKSTSQLPSPQGIPRRPDSIVPDAASLRLGELMARNLNQVHAEAEAKKRQQQEAQSAGSPEPRPERPR